MHLHVFFLKKLKSIKIDWLSNMSTIWLILDKIVQLFAYFEHNAYIVAYIYTFLRNLLILNGIFIE